MANTTLLFNNFTAGEVSPKIAARSDSAQYANGAKELVNCIPLRQGGLRKRPGTWFDGYTNGEKKARLAYFKDTDGTVFVFEFTDLACRIWTASYALFGSPLVITTPYPEAAIDSLKVAVSNRVMWIFHHSYAPRCITYNGTTFAISTPTFTGNHTFSTAGKYPAAGMIDAGRLWVTGMDSDPNATIGSRAPDSSAGTDRYTDFTIGSNAADAIYLRETDMVGSKMSWLFPGRFVIAATDRAIWVDTGAVPTPATFDMNIAAYSGASTVQGVGSGGSIAYLGRGGRSLRAMTYSSDDEAMVEGELSIASDHILISGGIAMDVTAFPEPIIWIVLSDGTLASYTVDQKGGIIAAARHSLGGVVESLIVTPGANGDIVWMSVARTITDQYGASRTARCLEHIVMNEILDEDIEEAHYVDSGKRISQTASATLSGLTHLVGKEVTALADGSPAGVKTVALDGSVVFDGEIELAHVGLPIATVIRPMSTEIPANGTSLGKKRRLEKAWLRLYASLGGSIGQNADNMQNLLYGVYGSTEYGEAIPPFTGDQEIILPGSIDTETNIRIEHSAPTPFNLLAIMAKIAILEV